MIRKASACESLWISNNLSRQISEKRLLSIYRKFNCVDFVLHIHSPIQVTQIDNQAITHDL